jgi:hypothetical protein
MERFHRAEIISTKLHVSKSLPHENRNYPMRHTAKTCRVAGTWCLQRVSAQQTLMLDLGGVSELSPCLTESAAVHRQMIGVAIE